MIQLYVGRLTTGK